MASVREKQDIRTNKYFPISCSGTFETVMPGTFGSAAGGTFETVMPGTFHSVTGGTFETVLGGTIKPLQSKIE